MGRSEIHMLVPADNVLGEGVRFDHALQSLDWVDIPGRKVHSATLKSPESTHKVTTLDIEPGFAVRTATGTLLVAGNNRLVDLASGHHAVIPGMSHDCAINDGAVHPSGQCLVFGGKHCDETLALAGMYLLGERFVELPWRFTVFNGPAFSSDGHTIYFADSPTGIIWKAPLDVETLTIRDRAVFVHVPSDAGFPDGMMVDHDGCLWCAHWDGWRITRYCPDGTVDRVISVPVARPTSLAFLPNEHIAFTSAKADEPEQPDAFPAGGLAACVTKAHGPASPRLNLAHESIRLALGGAHADS